MKPAPAAVPMSTVPKTAASEISGARLVDLQDNVEKVFRGKPRVVRLTLACLLAKGHLLLEDVPGVGKTTLALALARSMGLGFQRIQFTSDLLPSDIVGVTVFAQARGEFEFKPGPIFNNVILADEINRTTPRTQSALLEAMSDGRVSVEDRTWDLPDPFLVIATQNPLEHHGTYPLPESQLDRFLMRLSIGYPGKSVERSIVMNRGAGAPVDSLKPVLEPDEFAALQAKVDDVRIDESIVDYLMAIIDESRTDSRIRIGVSTRGALALSRVSRAYALVQGRDFVIPDDVRDLLLPVLSHRIALGNTAAGGDRALAESVIEDLATRVPVPK